MTPPEGQAESERCGLCGGTREKPEDVAVNFGIGSGGQPDIQPCQDEFHTQPTGPEKGEGMAELVEAARAVAAENFDHEGYLQSYERKALKRLRAAVDHFEDSE